MAEAKPGRELREVSASPAAALDPDRSESPDGDAGEFDCGGRDECEEQQESGEDDVELPEHVRKFVEVIHHVSAETGLASTVYLVGTAHVVKESWDVVEAVIKFVQPEAVFVELCKERCFLLLKPSIEVPTLKEMLDLWKQKKMNAFGIAYSYYLAKTAKKLEVFPGGEFRIAYEAARACHSLVILGDRPVSVTLKRTAAKLSFWQKIKVAASVLVSLLWLPSAEELDEMTAKLADADELTQMLQACCESFPSLMDTLLKERDLYMTYGLRSNCSKYSSIVAVVGKGHVPGIISNWDKHIELAPLMEIPEKKKSRKSGWAVASVALAITVGIGYFVLS